MNLKGYDEWKLRSPYDDMTAAEEEMQSMERRMSEMSAVLEECAEYFDDRSDISSEHDEDGSPRPNREMKLLQRIQEVL